MNIVKRRITAYLMQVMGQFIVTFKYIIDCLHRDLRNLEYL